MNQQNNILLGKIVAAKVDGMTPVLYRLGKKPDGTIVLQGCYVWTRGTEYGQEWKDMPTVELPC